MFENLLDTSIFVRILIFAIVSVFTINVIVGLISLGLSIYKRLKHL